MKFPNINRYWIGLIFSMLLLWWAVKPLLNNGYFPMHDDTQVARVIAMGSALREYQFPVRMVDGLGYGYGYPIFNFYSPLPYYVGGILYAVGIDPFVSTKIMFLLPILFGCVFLYMFLAPAYGIASAVIGALLFTYAPYHAVQLYVRGSVGEYWAIAFVPLLLLSIMRITTHKTYDWLAVGSLSMAAIITSHTILSVLVLTLYILCTILYFFYQVNSKKLKDISSYVSIILMVVGGLGVSAFFWLPAFLEMKYTGVSSMIAAAPTGFYDHFVCLYQLWDSPWGFGGSAPGCVNDGMSFKLGKVHILLICVSLCVYLWKRFVHAKKYTSFQIMIGITALVLSLFGVVEYSTAVWKLFPFTSVVQYPWRLLSVAMLASAVVGAYGISYISNSRPRILTALVVGIGIIAINAKLFVPKFIFTPDTTIFSASDIQFRVSKISDEYLPDSLIKPKLASDVPGEVLTAGPDSRITIQTKKSTYIQAQIEQSKTDVITLQKAAFPGWQFTIDGKSVQSDTIHGLPVFTLEKGNHTFEAAFKDTPIRSQSTIISVMTLILLGGLLFYGQKTKT